MHLRQSLALTALVSIFAIALIGNIFGTIYYLSSFTGGGPHFDYFVAMGLLIAQPCLLCIWCALGGQNPILRVLISMGMLTALTLTYAKVLENDGAPLEVTLIICGAVGALVVVLQIPLWIFRVSTKQAIVLDLGDSQSGSNQFGIMHLLIATALVAILTAVTKAYFPTGSIIDGSAPFSWIRLGIFLLSFAISIGLLTFLILAFVFDQKRRIVFLCFLFLFLLAAPLGCIMAMDAFPTFRRGFRSVWTFEIVANVSTIVWANALGVAAVLTVFYAIGFRLRKLE